MKALAHLTALALLTFALTTVTFARNASKSEGNFTIPDSVRVGTTDLGPGNYKAEWKQENGGAVKVDILQHGKVVATAEGKLKDLPQPAPYTTVTIKPLSDSAKILDEIDFGNRSQALVFGE